MNAIMPTEKIPKPTEILVGSMVFGSKLIQSPKTLIGMTQEIVRTTLNTHSHHDLNQDQYALLENGFSPSYIAVLVPGFQLDGTSLLGLKHSLNAAGIPAFFPKGLPHGKDAVMFRAHPEHLVERITKYVKNIQSQYPETQIILLGHSYGATQALHVTDNLGSSRITPVTIAGVLDSVGPMAQAGHALYYRAPSRVFAAQEDDFIAQARDIQLQNRHGVTFVDTKDGYLSPRIQAGVYHNELYRPNVIISGKESPGHYRQGRDQKFSQYIIDQVLSRLGEQKRLGVIQH